MGLRLNAPDLSDEEWSAIQPVLPKKVRGIKRVDDRRVLDGIMWRLRNGGSWERIPERYGSYGTCHTRFIRWRDMGVWAKIIEAVKEAFGESIQLIDASSTFVPAPYGRSAANTDDPVAWVLLEAEATRGIEAAA